MLITLFTTLLSAGLYAQNCSVAQLQNTSGSWKAGIQGSVTGVGAADLPKEKEVLAGIHKLLTTNYSPKGCEANYSFSYGSRSHYWADPYSYQLYILRYVCNKDKPGHHVEVSTPTTVRVAANVIPSMDNFYAADLRDEPRGYLKLRERPVWKDGYYFLGEEVVGDGHLDHKIKAYRYLITYDNELPFSYMSRKQYLLLLRSKLEQNIRESPGEAGYYRGFLNNISEYLKKPETELSKPAVCMWNQEERFEQFVEEGTKGSFLAVQPNPAYFRKLPRSSPQFISVEYKISHGDPLYEQNMAAIQRAVDLKVLKQMLGK